MTLFSSIVMIFSLPYSVSFSQNPIIFAAPAQVAKLVDALL